MASKNDIPMGVKIIAILGYIGAGLSALLGLILILGGGLIGGALSSMPALAFLGSGIMVVGGIFLLAMAVLGFFVAKGLWNLQNWARIVTIIIAALGVLGGLSSLFSGGFGSGLFNIVVDGLIGWYLLFNKEAVDAFK